MDNDQVAWLIIHFYFVVLEVQEDQVSIRTIYYPLVAAWYNEGICAPSAISLGHQRERTWSGRCYYVFSMSALEEVCDKMILFWDRFKNVSCCLIMQSLHIIV